MNGRPIASFRRRQTSCGIAAPPEVKRRALERSCRPRSGLASRSMQAVGAMASRLPDVSSVATSNPDTRGGALGTVLPVPRYSQMAHKGYYQQYDGGGAACTA